MQGVWGNAPGTQGGAQGFNPQAPAFNPSFGGGPRGGPNGGQGGHFNPSHPSNSHSKPTLPAPQPKSVVLPTKPEQEQICKHATECTKPPCPYSHPSPVATKESGLVLSSEACEQQLECKDPVSSSSLRRRRTTFARRAKLRNRSRKADTLFLSPSLPRYHTNRTAPNRTSPPPKNP